MVSPPEAFQKSPPEENFTSRACQEKNTISKVTSRAKISPPEDVKSPFKSPFKIWALAPRKLQKSLQESLQIWSVSKSLQKSIQDLGSSTEKTPKVPWKVPSRVPSRFSRKSPPELRFHLPRNLKGLSNHDFTSRASLTFTPARIVKKDLRKKYIIIVKNENLRNAVRNFASELPLRITDFRPGSV